MTADILRSMQDTMSGDYSGVLPIHCPQWAGGVSNWPHCVTLPARQQTLVFPEENNRFSSCLRSRSTIIRVVQPLQTVCGHASQKRKSP